MLFNKSGLEMSAGMDVVDVVWGDPEEALAPCPKPSVDFLLLVNPGGDLLCWTKIGTDDEFADLLMDSS